MALIEDKALCLCAGLNSLRALTLGAAIGGLVGIGLGAFGPGLTVGMFLGSLAVTAPAPRVLLAAYGLALGAALGGGPVLGSVVGGFLIPFVPYVRSRPVAC